MIAGLDVTPLLAGDTGVARYVRELSTALERKGVTVVRFAIGRGRARDALPTGTRHLPVPLRLVHRAWSCARTPSAERLAPGTDIVHATDLVPPPARQPVVLTVHDLVALEHPELHNPRSVAVQRAQLDAARHRATLVLSVSAATRRTLCEHGVDPDRVVVIPNGVTPLPAPDPGIVPREPFLLAVGARTPRKGLPTLVAAFSCSVPRPIRLVIAGAPGWDADRVDRAIREHDVSDRVTCTGRVSDAQLAALYRSCIAVCAPSVAEGFGLPLVEAAAAGRAVVASDIDAFREVGASVALFVAPGDVDAWSAALERIVADGWLRNDAAARGRRQVDGYTWERTASLTIEAYERARRTA